MGVFRDLNFQICPNHHTLITSDKVLKSVLPFDLILFMLVKRGSESLHPFSALLWCSHARYSRSQDMDQPVGRWVACGMYREAQSMATELEAVWQRMSHCLGHSAKDERYYGACQKGCTGKSSLGLLDQRLR